LENNGKNMSYMLMICCLFLLANATTFPIPDFDPSAFTVENDDWDTRREAPTKILRENMVVGCALIENFVPFQTSAPSDLLGA